MEIIPAIIPQDYEELVEKAGLVKDLVKKVQVDVLDGKYTANVSWPYQGGAQKDFSDLVEGDDGLPFWRDLNYEIDLMVKKPEMEMEKWIVAGAEGLIFHYESMDSDDLIAEVIKRVKYMNVSVGLAIKPSTPNSVLNKFLDQLDFVQFMGNDKIGEQGIELDEVVYQKIADLREVNQEIEIGVDIGVNEETAQSLVDRGATRLVSGSAIFESGDIRETIKNFQSI